MDNNTDTREFDKQQEEARKRLVQEDIQMHEETDDPSPFPDEAADKPKKARSKKRS